MKYLIILVSIFMTGCHTIHFDKGEPSESSVSYERWHHNFALDLYEGSAPVNPKERCGEKEWTSVKTELSFVNGLATNVGTMILPLWYPKTASVSCK
jgi:hypothetical protein